MKTLHNDNDDGKIDYEEFCLTASKSAENTNKETIDKAFKFFDQDNDNYISKDELKCLSRTATLCTRVSPSQCLSALDW